jgi:hypothetical protein
MQLPDNISISLPVHENGYWRDTENTIAVFDGFSNIPPVFQNYIDQIDPQKHHVVSKQSIKAPSDDGFLSLYRLTNEICNQAVYRAELIDAALQYSNPDMYLINGGFPVLIEHDCGYVLVSSVRVGGDPFWMIEGDIEDVNEGSWIVEGTEV